MMKNKIHLQESVIYDSFKDKYWSICGIQVKWKLLTLDRKSVSCKHCKKKMKNVKPYIPGGGSADL
jgi:hypothetical protein